ncbi:hypothetical protein Tco_0071459 [Tanacetum coccineum]
MDKKISTFAERQAENKRKLDNNNQAQQQLPKRQNVVQAYAAGTGERKSMLELFHYATSASFITMARALSDCPELKNRNHGNQAEGTEARGMVYALKVSERNPPTDQDLNNIEDEIEA